MQFPIVGFRLYNARLNRRLHAKIDALKFQRDGYIQMKTLTKVITGVQLPLMAMIVGTITLLLLPAMIGTANGESRVFYSLSWVLDNCTNN